MVRQMVLYEGRQPIDLVTHGETAPISSNLVALLSEPLGVYRKPPPDTVVRKR